MLDDTHCVRPIPELSNMRDVSIEESQRVSTSFEVADCPYACSCTADWADCSFKNDNHRKFMSHSYDMYTGTVFDLEPKSNAKTLFGETFTVKVFKIALVIPEKKQSLIQVWPVSPQNCRFLSRT